MWQDSPLLSPRTPTTRLRFGVRLAAVGVEGVIASIALIDLAMSLTPRFINGYHSVVSILRVTVHRVGLFLPPLRVHTHHEQP